MSQKIRWCISKDRCYRLGNANSGFESYVSSGECGCMCFAYMPRNNRRGMCRDLRVLDVTDEELEMLIANKYAGLMNHRRKEAAIHAKRKRESRRWYEEYMRGEE